MSTPKKVQVLNKFLQGLSAYEVAVKNGFEGTEAEWLLSLSEAGASVKYVYQELTDEQKARARENISVMSQEEIETLIDKTSSVVRYALLEPYDVEFLLGEFLTSAIYFPLTVGETYIVMWGDEEFECIAQAMEVEGYNAIVLGNGSIVGGSDDTGEPFAVGVAPDMEAFACYTNQSVSSKTVAIYQFIKAPTLPLVDAEDEGKFLRVFGGAWTAVTIASAEGSSF